MAKTTQPTDPQKVFCEVCLKSVPRVDALSSEGRDYVAYFCGAACYERWHRRRDEPRADSVEPDELPPD
ncbi:MAG: DUF3330 domain-containing protein [Vicinamibacteria bacterium]